MWKIARFIREEIGIGTLLTVSGMHNLQWKALLLLKCTTCTQVHHLCCAGVTYFHDCAPLECTALLRNLLLTKEIFSTANCLLFLSTVHVTRQCNEVCKLLQCARHVVSASLKIWGYSRPQNKFEAVLWESFKPNGWHFWILRPILHKVQYKNRRRVFWSQFYRKVNDTSR
jgi:hypothetical protein